MIKKSRVFSVTASTLSERDLETFIIKQYSLDKKSVCKLFRTGINHTYFVTNKVAKYVFRVYSYQWRTRQEILNEIDLLNSLKKNGINVSYPICDINNGYIQEIHAPEGTRYAVLFSYAYGDKVRFMDNEICRKIGLLMAKLHSITQNKSLKRIDYNSKTLLELPYQYAQSFFSDKLPEMVCIKKICTNIKQSLKEINAESFTKGIIHFDIWYDNMNITTDKEITLFDFDFSGSGWFILDIAYFCKQLFHIETDKKEYEQKMRSFIEGYESIRKLSKEEFGFIPKAGAAAWIFYLGVQSQRFDWSNIFLTKNYLTMYVGKMKSWLDYYKTKNNCD